MAVIKVGAAGLAMGKHHIFRMGDFKNAGDTAFCDTTEERLSGTGMLKYVSIFALLVLPCLTCSAGGTNDQQNAVIADRFLDSNGNLKVETAVDYFEDLYRSESSISEAELKIVRPRRRRTLTMKVWTKGDEKALVVIQSPPREEGTATLKVGDNLWNYLPKINRTIRIPPSMMLSSWMGSDFTNDDLVRESSYKDDYTYKAAGKSDDPPGWIIEFSAKEGTVGLWKRFTLTLSPDGTIPLSSRWYNHKGELARILTWDKVRVMDGKKLPSRMTLVPVDKDDEGHKTVMTYKTIDFDAEIPADMFSLSRLERKR